MRNLVVDLDVEAAVVALLSPLPGFTTHTQFPEDPTFPLVLIHRSGGGMDQAAMVVDAATVQVDAWGQTKTEAYDTVQAARTRLLNIDGEAVGSVWISKVEESGAFLWLPDPESGRPRYTCDLRLYVRGMPLP